MDASGNSVSLALEVRDAAGRDVTNTNARGRKDRSLDEPVSTMRKVVGPLPPGSYEITGTVADGQQRVRSVTLPRAGLELKLRF